MKLSNNRSVMPLDVQGCTRATLEESACCNHYRKILLAAINSANCRRIEHKDFECTLHHRVDSRWAEVERICWDPKDGELYLSRMKPEETLVEVRSDSDVQIDRMTLV
ncbi:Cytochrome c oxidase assembly protein [Dirofilaria immitis]